LCGGIGEENVTWLAVLFLKADPRKPPLVGGFNPSEKY